MRWLALLLAPAIAVGQEEIRNPRTSPAGLAAGAKIYRGHCAECHRLDGEGGRGPRLTTGVYYHGSTGAALFRNITDGIEGTAMPSVFFSADQVWQIVATSPGKVRRPRRRSFEDGQCAGLALCHTLYAQS